MRYRVGWIVVATLAVASSLVAQNSSPSKDWLLGETRYLSRVSLSEDGASITLENGLVRRRWRLRPNLACVAFDHGVAGASLLRAVRPEARLVLNGITYGVGGLKGQANHAFLLPEWQGTLTADQSAFQYLGHKVAEIEERLAWKRTRGHDESLAWPPPGKALVFRLGPGSKSDLPKGVEVEIRYELYDGLPLIGKRIRLINKSQATIELDRLCTEILALVEEHNWVEARDGVTLPRPSSLHVETDYAFGGFVTENAQRQIVHWRPDPDFHTQVNYKKETPCLLEVEPLRGPDQLIPPGETFTSFWTFELAHDSSDRERRGLGLRRMYRTLAPWVTENPLTLHVVSTQVDVVRQAIDQAADCGFEMLSLSFGSGLSMEDDRAANHEKFKELADYAQAKGIEIGGYSLLASRRIKPDTDNCIHPETKKPGGQTFGFAPALASNWGLAYFAKLRRFFEATGFAQFTHDGSYPGDFDAVARPPLQRGLDDSQWVQWRIITDFYRWLRARGAYLRVPDYYYLQGSNECGMGYREVNWSLPRAQQVIHTRQNIFDGTWTKTPSMGWMFVPLTQYHGGGAAATIEPLDEHLDHYERMLASNLGLGVQAVYRGTRLYDTPRVRDAVRRWVAWYKNYRAILESDLIHGRRADGRDLDWMIHVNPRLENKAMLVVYNPLDRAIKKTIRVPLRFSGLRDTCQVFVGQGSEISGSEARPLNLSRDYTVDLEVEVAAGGMSWYCFR